ncbi:15623_t:CDS:2, partial [Acaulospora colombiana]
FQLNAPRFHNEAQFRSALIEPTIRVLAKKANGLFLWAQLAFEVFLSAENPTKSLLNLVEEDALATIDGLYLEMLLLIQVKLDRKDKELDKELLSTFNPSKGDWAGQVKRPFLSGPLQNLPAWASNVRGHSCSTCISYSTSVHEEIPYIHRDHPNGVTPCPAPTLRSPIHLTPPAALFLLLVQSKSSTSLNAGSTPFTDIPFPMPSGEPDTSMDLIKTAGLSTAFPGQSGPDLRSGALVRIKHATFREWLCQSHPPTLISSLIGASVDEEEDLRFVVAPTEEVGQAMLAKGSLGLLTTSAASAASLDSHKDDADKPVDGKPKSVKDGENTQQEEMLDYAGRYWPAHCASLISALHSVDESAMYANSTMTPGSRWYDLRQDMLQFLKTNLLWWVDTCCSKKWIKQARSGMVELREVLLDVIPEEDLQADINDLTQWVEEAIRLLDSPSGASSIPIDNRTDDHSLIWRHYSTELVRREEALEILRREEERRKREEEDLKAREEEERRIREEAERKAREEAERKAREEAERKAREEAERKSREEAECKAREEAEHKAREEAERKAREEAERKTREEAERRAREEAERKSREEALRKAREETKRISREATEQKAREEAERRVREEAERKTREEALRMAQREAERAAREEAGRKAARDEAERKVREQAHRKAHEDAERIAREVAERSIQEEVARIAQEAERKIQEEAALEARQEADRKAKEELERKLLKEAEARTREEERRRRAMQEQKESATRKRRETEGSDHRVPQEREAGPRSVLPRGRARSDGASITNAGVLDLKLPEDMSLLDSFAALSFGDDSFQVDSPTTASRSKVPKAASDSNTDGDGHLSTDKDSTRSIPVTPTSDLEPSIPTSRDETAKIRLYTRSPAPSNAPTVRPTPAEASSKTPKLDTFRATNSNPRSGAGRRPVAPQPGHSAVHSAMVYKVPLELNSQGLNHGSQTKVGGKLPIPQHPKHNLLHLLILKLRPQLLLHGESGQESFPGLKNILSSLINKPPLSKGATL